MHTRQDLRAGTWLRCVLGSGVEPDKWLYVTTHYFTAVSCCPGITKLVTAASAARPLSFSDVSQCQALQQTAGYLRAKISSANMLSSSSSSYFLGGCWHDRRGSPYRPGGNGGGRAAVTRSKTFFNTEEDKGRDRTKQTCHLWGMGLPKVAPSSQPRTVSVPGHCSD